MNYADVASGVYEDDLGPIKCRALQDSTKEVLTIIDDTMALRKEVGQKIQESSAEIDKHVYQAMICDDVLAPPREKWKDALRPPLSRKLKQKTKN